MKVKLDVSPNPGTYLVVPPYGFIVAIKGKAAIIQLAENFGYETDKLEKAVKFLDKHVGEFLEYADTIVVDGKKKKFPWNPKKEIVG